jgi:drug/metabolite transporter (DMT)-like permease
MQHELLIAVFAGMAGMIGWGLADFFAKKTIDAIGDIASLAWAHVFGTVALFSVVFFQVIVLHKGLPIPHDLQTWFFLIFFGVLQAAIYLLVYKGFGKGQVAVLNPVFASFSGLTAIMSIMIFGEIVSGSQIISLVILFSGVLLLNIDVDALRSKKITFIHVPGFREVALATVLASVWTLLWDTFISGRDWLSFTFSMYAFMTVTIFAFARFKRVKLSFAKPSFWKFLILIGVCETLAYLGISIGYSATSFTSIIAVLSGAFSLPTIILARIFLKEKITSLQTIGSIIIIIGIILLSLF